MDGIQDKLAVVDAQQRLDRQRGDNAVEPATGQARPRQMFRRPILQIILCLEMAAAARGAGNGVQQQRLIGLIQPVQPGQRRMQAIKPAEIT